MSVCYVGRCKCGQIVAATVMHAERQKQVARDVAEFIKEGLSVEQMDTEQVRVTLHRCTCPKESRQAELALEEERG